MRLTKILLAALVVCAIAVSFVGCKEEPILEETTVETASPMSVDEIEKKAQDAGFTCRRKGEAGIREINDDLTLARVSGNLINCMTVSSSADHTGAIVFEFDSEESVADFYERAEEMLGKLKDGMSKDRRGKLFIYGNTSVIEKIW